MDKKLMEKLKKMDEGTRRNWSKEELKLLQELVDNNISSKTVKKAGLFPHRSKDAVARKMSYHRCYDV